LPNRILPSLRRVFPFATYGHWILQKNKLKNSFFSVHFLGTSSLLAFYRFRSTLCTCVVPSGSCLSKFFENTRDCGLGEPEMVSTRLPKNS
jgi:hypothetical protein